MEVLAARGRWLKIVFACYRPARSRPLKACTRPVPIVNRGMKSCAGRPRSSHALPAAESSLARRRRTKPGARRCLSLDANARARTPTFDETRATRDECS